MPVSDSANRTLRKVAGLVAAADALLVTAGAGMSADSGLPVFRGNEGFWRAYPPLAKLGISFERMAQPGWFHDKPRMAWAFYGHRQQLYRGSMPHAGHGILRRWAAARPGGNFVVTSNVDGQFEGAGFPSQCVVEQHGSIHRLQCSVPCSADTWNCPQLDLQIDLGALEAAGELPLCPRCGAIARPNILMFNDPAWIRDVTLEQSRAFDTWLAGTRGRRLLVIEIGAGTVIPTIRRVGERAAQRPRTTLVRINPQDVEGDEGVILLRLGALQALSSIDAMPARDAHFNAAPPPAADPGFDLLPPREMGQLDFVPQARERPVVTCLEEKLGLALLPPFNLADLCSGTLQTFDAFFLDDYEEAACLAQWYEAQRSYAPLPLIRHYRAEGFTMSGGVLDLPAQRAGGAWGGASFNIKGPGGELVSTLCMARRAREGGRMWRYLYESTRTPLRPMDYPREPWIGRRLEPGHAHYPAMLATLFALECAIAVPWIKHQALHERQLRG